VSVHFISGKPGGGKSLYAVRLVVDELVHGTRCIVTNLSLRPGELNAYLQEKFPKASVDLVHRLRILSDDETAVFWTIRGPGSVGAPLLKKEQWDQGLRPDYSGVVDGGVLYCIDEIHNFF